MDKRQFIELAPYYYANAIVEYIRTPKHLGRAISREAVVNAFTNSDPNEPNFDYCYVTHQALLDRGFRLLIERGMLHEMGDSFGPPLYFPKETFNDIWEKLREDQNLPFFMYSNAPKR